MTSLREVAEVRLWRSIASYRIRGRPTETSRTASLRSRVRSIHAREIASFSPRRLWQPCCKHRKRVSVHLWTHSYSSCVLPACEGWAKAGQDALWGTLCRAAPMVNIEQVGSQWYCWGMGRDIVWVETQNFQGWACSACAWVFNPSGAPIGKSIEEMKRNYERQRDKEFASHACAAHPRAKSAKTK